MGPHLGDSNFLFIGLSDRGHSYPSLFGHVPFLENCSAPCPQEVSFKKKVPLLAPTPWPGGGKYGLLHYRKQLSKDRQSCFFFFHRKLGANSNGQVFFKNTLEKEDCSLGLALPRVHLSFAAYQIHIKPLHVWCCLNLEVSLH